MCCLNRPLNRKKNKSFKGRKENKEKKEREENNGSPNMSLGRSIYTGWIRSFISVLLCDVDQTAFDIEVSEKITKIKSI